MATQSRHRLSEPVSARDHIRGPRSAVISLVEYGDFECPCCRAAEVAEAAAAQGRFWEMHDMLFANQNALDDASLVNYAANLMLDVDRVRRELASHEHAGRVAEDRRSGLASGVNGTPTFYINGA